MADFDKNLQAIVKPTGIPLENVPIGEVEKLRAQSFNYSGADLSKPMDGKSFLDSLSNKGDYRPKGLTITNKELDDNRRYKAFNPTIPDYEDFAAQGQSTLSKGVNGTLKGVNLAGTTIAGTFAALGGALASPFTGKLSTIWDNPVMNALDEWNQKVDNEYLPNYYTNKETQAEWYSTDNWFRANFLFDKLIKNAGFAVGAMYSGNIANAALLRAGGLIGKTLTAAESAQAFKLFSPVLNSTSRAFSAGKNIEAATILEARIASIADITARSSELAKIAKTTGQFANFGDKARRTLVAAYSSAGESSFEALQTSNEYRERLIEAYIKENGREPLGGELEAINTEANQVGLVSFLGNMALLGATEYVQLPYLLGSSYKNSRSAATAMLGKTDDVIIDGGKYAAKVPTTRFGKLYDKGKKLGVYIFDPKEAFQEMGQFALSVGTQNYFEKAKLNGDADLLVDGLVYGFLGEDKRGEGVGAFNSKEGIEGGILGAITGGLMQTKGRIRENKASLANTTNLINQMNLGPTFKEAFQYKKDAVNRANVLHAEQQDAVIQGEVLESKDLKSDLMFTYLSPRVKYGRFDLIMDDLDQMVLTASTEQGLADLKEQGIGNINDTRQEFTQRVMEVKENAKALEKIYKNVNLVYGAKIKTLPDGRQVRLFNDALLDRMAYAASKIVDYDMRIPDVSASLLSAGILVQDIVNEELSSDTSIALGKALMELENDTTLQDPSILQQELKDVVEMSLRRKKFVEEYKNMITNPDAFDNAGNPVQQYTPEGKKKRTTRGKFTDRSSRSRFPFKGDKRTYDDLVKQYGEGTTSKRAVLQKIMNSPLATTIEKRLAEMFLKYTSKDSKIVLGDRTLESAGVSVSDYSSPGAAVSYINYESSAFDYEGTPMPVEHVLLHEIGHDLTTFALADPNSDLSKDLKPLFEFVKDHFQKDPEKYAEAGIIDSGEFYGMQNLQEFATEALSNRDFQRYLSTIPYKATQKSTWETFTDNIRTFFRKLFNITEENVLDEIIAVVTNNIDEVHSSVREMNQKLEEEETALAAAAEKLAKEQKEIEKKSGQVPGAPTETFTPEQLAPGEKRKDAEALFKSSTTESEGFADTSESSLHIKNTREFFNKLKNFKNRNKLRAVVVTAKQLKYLGLEELVKLSYKTTGPVEEIEGVMDVETGFVAQLYVIQESRNTYLVDKDGNKIGKLGDTNIDLSKVLFQTMPTTSLYYANGTPRFQPAQEELAKREAAAYSLYRKSLFAAEENDFLVSRFTISRGIAKLNPTVDGKKENNHIGNILVPEEQLSSEQGMIVISKDGKIPFNNQTITFPVGVPVLKYKDTLQYLNNTKFSKEKAENIYAVINAMAKDIIEKSLTRNKVTINRAFSTYLQNVLYWKSQETTTTPNQIHVDSQNKRLFIGEKSYDLVSIDSFKNEIVEGLTEAYFSTNEQTLSKEFNKAFTEFIVNPDGQLDAIIWENYQTFLLSATNPDGSKRSVDSTPLVTNVAKPTEAVPYSFEQKYAILEDIEFPYDQLPKVAPKPAPKPPETPKTSTKLGEYVLDGVTTNIHKLAAGNIEFTASESSTGELSVVLKTSEESTINKTTIDTVVKNRQTLNAVLPLVGIPVETIDTMTEEAIANAVADFIAKRIVSELVKLKAEVVPTPAPVVEETPPTPPKPGSPKYNPKNTKGSSIGTDFRLRGKDSDERMTENDLEVFQAWAKENVPNIPYEILEKMITTVDGEKAWGVFENGVAKFVRGGLKGTEYHEVFEAIWNNFLSTEEQQLLLEEFRNKPGQFTDRASKKKYNNDDASVSDNMVKERIADDFADFRVGKLPARSLGQKLYNFFKGIIDFFKSFVAKPSLKTDLFNAINEGKFANRQSNQLNGSPEYRAVGNLSTQQTYEYVQDMTAYIAAIIYKDDKALLYNPTAITGEEIFNAVKTIYESEGKIDELGESTWLQLVKKTKEHLRTLGINITTEDLVDFNNSENNSRGYAPEAFSQDWKKTSSGALKFAIATLLERVGINQQGKQVIRFPQAKRSSIGGLKLVNFSKAFAVLADKLANTTSFDVFADKFVELIETDADFVAAFQRAGGNLNTKDFNFDDFDYTDWRFFIEFYQTFTKQKPEALIQYIKEDEVFSAPANIYTSVSTTRKEWIENMKTLALEKDSLVNLVSAMKVYRVDTTKLRALSIKSVQDKIDFLAMLGIDFPMNLYKALKAEGRGNNDSQRDQFSKAVSSIHRYLGENNDLMTIKGKTLDVGAHITKLAELYTRVNNPNIDPTYFGVEGQKIGTYTDSNAVSVFESDFNESDTLQELLEKRPELNDVFSKNSQILKPGGLFFDKNGNRVKEIKVKYIQGTSDTLTKKGITTSNLNIGQRYIQEINQNLNGNYYTLIPADGSTEWMMSLGNVIEFKAIQDGKPAINKMLEVFNGYLLDEVNLALDFETRQKTLNIKDKAKQLRFFREILLLKDVTAVENIIADDNIIDKLSQIEDYIYNNSKSINDAILAYVNNTVKETISTLVKNNIIVGANDKNLFTGLDTNFIGNNKLKKFELTDKDINDIIMFANVNYIINNFEYHKFVFGDPYQFKIKGGNLDETKRIKSFLSPRRRTFDSTKLNTFLNQEMNLVDGVVLKKEDPGYHDYKSYTNTATLQDANIAGSLSNIVSAFSKTNETDGMSWLKDTTYKEIKIKNRQWGDKAEAWHQWEMAFTRQNMPGYVYTSKALEKHDKDLLTQERPEHKIEVLKPIVSGVKNNVNHIDLILDKFSQMPIYYSMVMGTNLEKLYTKMMKENLGYVIVESGRKVGSEGNNPIYNQDGSFNETPYENLIEVPWKSYGIQVETVDTGEKTQTRGSQLTKLASIDIYNNGEAISEEAEKEYKRNTELLSLMHENAYRELLNSWGVIDTGDGYNIPDGTAISETLMYEMMRRNVSSNTKETLELNADNQFIIPFEASTAYLQIRSILYSSINKTLISPKMSGGAHVQVPVTMFEKATEGRALAVKTEKGWQKLTNAEYAKLSEEDKKKVVLTDNTLKFYTKEAPYMEIMLPAWFKEKFSKSKYPTDEALLKYLNSNEGGKILRGIGFRIPTQSLSSAEVFKVKGFLPSYMGATVVVPSEITTKAGSDFDIDKLNMYLKSIYIDSTGNIKLVTLKGTEENTKKFYGEVFDKKIENKLLKKSELLEAVDIIIYAMPDPKGLLNKYGEYIVAIKDEYEDPFLFKQEIEKQISKLTDKNIVSYLREDFAKKMYKKALENEYYDSLEKLLTLPENFERLISPVDDAGLEDLSIKLDELRGYDEGAIKGRMLDRNYLTNLRHAFVMGKKWIGIAAVNITSLSLRQKSQVFIDTSKFAELPSKDRKYLGDGKIVLDHNKVDINGVERVSLSGIMTANKGKKEYISSRLSGYATSFVDVAKNPYILKIIQSDLVVGVFMFLENIGAGNQGAMFLNQPIVAEYIKMLDAEGTKGLFNSKKEKIILSRFPSSNKEFQNAKVVPENFEDNIINYYQKGKLTSEQNAEQQRIFLEFLKYAKMASFVFKFTQATNYDTTRFSSNDALTRKQWRTINAENSNIISSVNNVLSSTFIGKQATLLDESMQALASVFKLDSDSLRVYTDVVLKRYAEDDFMSQDKFDTVANKIRASFLDYIVQTKLGLNTRLKELLIDPETSVATQLDRLKKKYPDVDILKDLYSISGDRINGAKTVTLKANIKDPYDEDRYTDMMREMRDYNEELKGLYENIVLLAIYQGTYQSAISLKNIIPLEDYGKIVTPVINALTPGQDLEAFSKGIYQRNHFTDETSIPTVQPYMFKSEDPIAEDFYQAEIYRYINTEMFPNIEALGVKSSQRRILLLNEDKNDFYIKNDYLKVNRIIKQGGENVDIVLGQTVTNSQFRAKLVKGDPSIREVFGYEKVYLPIPDEKGNKIPLTFNNAKRETVHVYKLINLLGDGPRAFEYYTAEQPSVFDNGGVKTVEFADKDLIEYFGGEQKVATPKQAIPSTAPVIQKSSELLFERTSSIISRIMIRNNRDVLYVFGDNDMRKGFGGQAKEMRGEPNSFGISTKVSPNSNSVAYKSDSQLEKNKQIITTDINKIIEAWNSGKYKKIVVPPIGVGLADLPNKAPLTWEFLNQELKRLEEYVSEENLGEEKTNQLSLFDDPFNNPPTTEDENNCN